MIRFFEAAAPVDKNSIASKVTNTKVSLPGTLHKQALLVSRLNIRRAKVEPLI